MSVHVCACVYLPKFSVLGCDFRVSLRVPRVHLPEEEVSCVLLLEALSVTMCAFIGKLNPLSSGHHEIRRCL